MILTKLPSLNKIIKITYTFIFSTRFLHLVFTALVAHWFIDFYNKIDSVAKYKYNINISIYEKKLKEIYSLFKNSSSYIKSVEKVEIEDRNNATVYLNIRKEIFCITDGNKIYVVSDDNKILSEKECKNSLPIFFYPNSISPTTLDKIDDMLFKYYETIANNIKALPNLNKVKIFYIKPSYDILHLYFWLDGNIKFYAGHFTNITKGLLYDIDKKLSAALTKIENLKDFRIFEVDLSFKKTLVKLY